MNIAIEPDVYDIEALVNEFTALEEVMSDLIFRADSLATDGDGKFAWDSYKHKSKLREERINTLFSMGKSDDLSDYVHDGILFDGEDFPAGYSATVIASVYSTIMRTYNTYSIVNTPKQSQYLLKVSTYRHVKLGTTYKG